MQSSNATIVSGINPSGLELVTAAFRRFSGTSAIPKRSGVSESVASLNSNHPLR